MSDNAILLDELKQNWKTLFFDTQKNKRLKFDMFSATFSQTYSLLSEHLAENSLDKNFIELIAEAYVFANIKSDSLDSKCLAAFILTERMLNHCVFNSAQSDSEGTYVYVFEARKDIRLNFADVDASINKLEKIFEKNYWETLNS